MEVRIAGGAILMALGIWGGAFLAHTLDRWGELPAIISGILVCCTGFAIVAVSIENEVFSGPKNR